MDITLHPATEADLPLITVLAHRIWWEHYPAIVSEAQITYMLELMYSEAALQRQIEEGQVFWMVENESQAIGYLSVSQQAESDYFLHKFYLDGRARGIGTVVFQQLLAQYPDLRTLRLNVNRRNFKSVNFYFKVGFRIESCMDTPFGEGYLMDDFQMIFAPS
jgi:RimJ/RimL family protein N-acetyltransferase